VGGGVVALLDQTKTESNFAAVHGHARTQQPSECSATARRAVDAAWRWVCCCLSTARANAYMSKSNSKSESMSISISISIAK
jgi:hypothetical protein